MLGDSRDSLALASLSQSALSPLAARGSDASPEIVSRPSMLAATSIIAVFSEAARRSPALEHAGLTVRLWPLRDET